MVFVPFHKTSRSGDPKGKCHFEDINLRLCSEHLSISLPRARESIYIERPHRGLEASNPTSRPPYATPFGATIGTG